MKKRCTILGWFGYNNLGDEMILHTLLSHLNADKYDLTIISKDPKQTQKIHNTKAVSNNWKALSPLHNSDIIIFAGGQIFNDNRFRTIPYWSLTMNLIHLINRKAKICLINQGFEAKNRLLKKILSSTISKANLISVRDSASLNLTSNLKLNPPPSIGPDIVFSNTTNITQTKTKPTTIGVNIRPPFWWRNKTDANQHVKLLASLFDLLIEKENANIIFIPFRLPGKESHTDLDFSQTVKSKMKHQKQAEIYVCPLDNTFFNNLVNCYSSFTFLLGTTFHSIILSTKLAIPFLAFPYQERCKILLQDLNLTHLLINSEDLSSLTQLYSKISFTIHNQNNIRTQLQSKKTDLSEKAKKAHIEPLISKISITKQTKKLKPKQSINLSSSNM